MDANPIPTEAHPDIFHPERIVSEEDLLTFVAESISSVWALELLLLLRRDAQRSWQSHELIGEMRSSAAVIAAALAALHNAGLVVKDGTDGYRYQAASERLDHLVSELEREYAAKPMTVIKAIVAAPSDKLRIFSDAFKFKD
jgi:hypothetical protein